jgi:broad specificity phosphatase PhoE
MFLEPDRRRIYLMRHAEAAYLTPDGTPVDDVRVAGLTSNGEVQARSQAGLLESVSFDRVICSNLPRTRATARIVLAGRARPDVEQVAALEEIRGDGRHEPEDFAAWLRHVANPWADAAAPDARFLGGERFADFEARVVPAFRALITAPGWRTMLVVAHGGVNRLLLNQIMNLPWQGTVSIEQDAACINIIDVDFSNGLPVRYLVRGVNITGYNLNKSGIVLTDMERIAQRLAAAPGRR